MKLADFPEVQALSVEEKLRLVDELLQDMAKDLNGLGVSATEKQILEERWARFLRDPSSALTAEETMARVKKLRA